jgi:hypothetical protein
MQFKDELPSTDITARSIDKTSQRRRKGTKANKRCREKIRVLINNA